MAYEGPNYTQLPNAFFDEHLAEIDSMSELKVTLAIARQTLGFHQQEKWLTVSRIMELTGLSKPSAVDGIKRALKRGNVTRRQENGKHFFSLAVKNLNHSGKESLPGPVKNLNPRKEKKRKETSKENAASGQKLKANELMAEIVDLCTAAEFEVFDYQKRAWAGEFRRLLDRGVDRKRVDAIQEVIQAQAGDGFYCSVKKAQGILDNNTQPHDKHETNAKAEATPRSSLTRLEAHTDLKDYAELARRFDFTSSSDPPWQVMNRLGGTPDEQYRNLTRIRSVVGSRTRDVDEEHARQLEENQRMLEEMLANG